MPEADQEGVVSSNIDDLRARMAKQQSVIVAIYRSGQHARLPEENQVLEQIRREWLRACSIEQRKVRARTDQ